jgi:hypothetical protein
MNSSGIETLSILLVFMIFFLDKTRANLEQFLGRSIPPKTQEIAYGSFLKNRRMFYIQIIMGVLLEIGMISIYLSEIIDIISSTRFSFVKPDVPASLSVLIYICLFGLLSYSISMLTELRNKRRD